MNQEGTKRKLAAILSADVKEYSRLMSQDERGTIRTLTAYKEAMSSLIQEYKGRVVDAPGDNLLAEFGSVVDAVNCAVEVQRDLAERNADLPPARQMEFRIGINVGDIVEEEKRIYGDGVNIAARLESLAEGGGICISGKVHEEVKNKLGLEYEFLGEQEVKNIAEPVPAYRVLSFPGAAAHRVVKAKRAVGKTWRNVVVAIVAVLVVGAAVTVWQFYFRPPPIEPASIEKMAFPLPDEPSIAVLPFVNMSGDPEQEYFSDGLTEEIISGLSKLPKLFVIARNSTFTYKGKPVKVQQVSEELGVRYVLEGSVRKAGDRVRITAQLIDAITGHHIWSERYDRDLTDIFALQDQITMSIMTALQIKLTEGELARPLEKGTKSLEAYTKYIQAREHARRRTREDNAAARRIIKEAIAIDPEYAAPYSILAITHMMDIWLKTSKSPRKSLGQAIQLTQKSISMDDSYHHAQALLGWLYIMARQYDKAIAECERAVTLAPNAADAYSFLGMALRFVGRHEEAVRAAEKATRLDPFPSPVHLTSLGACYFFTGRYEKAIEAGKKAVRESPDGIFEHFLLAVAYKGAGREEEARAEAEEVLRIDPKFSVESFAKQLYYKNPSDKERLIEAMRKVGFPETPPLPLPDKPSIAVLPFVNMSGDPEQEYFSDGITEEIITALSKTPKLFVIARNSTFTYKGKPVKVQQVGRELGVKYVLEGSVRKAEEKVRITAQLVDTKTGNHLWAERYDRAQKDIFALQDEITMKIIKAMQVKLTEGEQAHMMGRKTTNLDAYLKYLQGREHFRRMNKEANALARKITEEVIALDPEYPSPYLVLAWTHVLDVWYKSSRSPKESLKKASILAQKIIALDESYAPAYSLLGYLLVMKRDHDKAIALAEKAVTLDPNMADAHAFLARNLNFADRCEESIVMYKKALRLNPFPPSWYYYQLSNSYSCVDKYEDAIEAGKKAVHLAPNSQWAHFALIYPYYNSGREQEARAEATEVHRIDPKFSVEHFAKTLPFKNQARVERIVDALRKAGLK
jgi:adenylate cyclase